MSPPGIILASGSAIRARILSEVGVPFEVLKPGTDEDEIKLAAKRDGISLGETAQLLADAKCLAVATKAEIVKSDKLVIGSDQIMEFQSKGFDKPASMKDARARIELLQGKTHALLNAITVARGGKIIWRNLSCPQLTMRKMSATDIDAYLTAAGPEILHSVGAYQVEKLGGRLFEKIEGDYFAVLGLTLFPLLEILRQEGALEF